MFISSAMAAEGATSAPGGEYASLIMIAVFGLIFYFMIFRPQSKRAKDHKDLMSSVALQAMKNKKMELFPKFPKRDFG